jgi:hypothetical protein
LPQGPRARALDLWHAALAKTGGDPSNHRVGIIHLCRVTDDAERDFAPIRKAERRHMALYTHFRAEPGGYGVVAGITEELRTPQGWVVGTLDKSRRSRRSSANTG